MLREFFPQFYIHHNFFGRFQHGIRLEPSFFYAVHTDGQAKIFSEAAMEILSEKQISAWGAVKSA